MLHYTAMASAQAALGRLCDPAAEVSSHYLIGEAGETWQLVDEQMRAWHAGVGSWKGRGDVNSRSIGIELANPGNCPFPEPLMASLEALLADILSRHRLGPAAVIGHSDLAPDRKRDPGGRFDWARLARADLAIWPQDPVATEVDEAQFASCLARIGYSAAVAPEILRRAFRLRFRPGAIGPLDEVDMGIAVDLAGRFGVDRAPSSA